MLGNLLHCRERIRIVPVRLLILAILFTTAGSQLRAAEKDSAAGRVCFTGFVNWDFHHRQKLRAWKTTAQVIQQTLDAWHIQSRPHLLVENGSPESLRQFLHALPAKNSCDIGLVYLASHQSAAAEWDFTQKQTWLVDDIVAGTTIPTHPRRIVILDACFAAALPQPTRLRLAPIFLFASSPSEETPMVDFHTPQPVDFAHRYPATFAWLKECLGQRWDGKISFLGFVWAETFLAAKKGPDTIRDWIDFLHQCQSTARGFRENVSRKASSEFILSVD